MTFKSFFFTYTGEDLNHIPTLFNPLIFFKQTDNSSLDSNAAETHMFGGCKYLCDNDNINEMN